MIGVFGGVNGLSFDAITTTPWALIFSVMGVTVGIVRRMYRAYNAPLSERCLFVARFVAGDVAVAALTEYTIGLLALDAYAVGLIWDSALIRLL